MDVIIVPTDFSDNAEKALDQALLIAQKTGSELDLLHTIELEHAESAYFQMRIMKDAQMAETRLNNLVLRRIQALGISPDLTWRVHIHYKENFEKSIQALIDQTGARLVVMGTKGVHNWADKLFGSHTATLIGKAKVPVLSIPLQWQPAPVDKLAACMEPGQVQEYEDEVRAWGQWLDCEVEWLHFTAAEVEKGSPTSPGTSLPYETVPSPVDSPLYKNIVEHSRHLKSTILIMFVRPRSFFKKLFDPSLTKKTAGLIEAPLLAIPGKD
jgi:nucleotide-binding universal stress UspA family protein